MSVPQDGDREILHARDVLAGKWRHGRQPTAPGGVILCHQVGLLGNALPRWPARRLRGFSADVRLLRGGGVAVATGFGIGAPAAVALLEELVAVGVKKFASLGVAGGLREDAVAGDLVVVDRALCDDGTSRHYGQADGVVEASRPLTARLGEALSGAGAPHVVGTVCSTDAPYRTTQAAVRRWTVQGGIAVDMEAAGLLAAARFRGVEMTVACCIADHMSPDGWRLEFDRAAVAAGLQALYRAAGVALAP